MKKITYLMVFFVTCCLWQTNAQTTYNGAGTPAPLGPNSGTTTTSAANVSATGVIGANPGEYNLDQVSMNLQHTWASDLDIVIEAPSGATVDLSLGNGGSTGLDTPATLVFTDISGNNVAGWSGGAPAANYQAEEGLLNTLFAGENVNGDWTISLTDNANGDGGTLNSYSITFTRIPIGNPPVIACAGDISADTDPGECSAIVNFADAIAFDIEDGPLTPTQTAGPTSGSAFPVGDTTVEYSVTDSDGNTQTCSFIVTVTDTEAPVAECQNITIELDAATGMAMILPSDIDNGSSDNCGIDSYSLDVSSFDCSNVGENTVTLTVTDAEGNSTDCTATVTVEDNTAPVIACIGEPGDITVIENFDAGLPATWSTIVNTGTCDWQNGTDLPTGDDFTTPAMFFDDDDCGSGAPASNVTLLSEAYDLTGAVSASITYDVAFQEISLGETFTVEVYDGSAWQQVALYDADLDPDIQTETIDVAAFINANFQVRWTYDDGGGWAWHAGVDNFQLDYSVPATPLDVVLDANGMATIDASDLLLSVEEACGFVVTTGGPATASNVTVCGNAPLDIPAGAPGTTSGPMDPSVAPVTETGTIGTDYTLDNITLNIEHSWASDMDITLTSPSGTTIDVMLNDGGSSGLDTAATLVFTDDSVNNVDDFNGDTTGPLADYLPEGGLFNTVFAGEPINGDWTLNIVDNVGGDFGALNSYCITFAPIIDTAVSFDCSQLGENQIEVFVTDDSGNVSSCISTVNVIDETAPVLVCADTTIELGEDGTATIDPMALLAVADASFDAVVIGSDNGSFAVGTTDFVVTVASDVTVSFDWDFTTDDTLAGFDSFGYLVNGTYTQLTDDTLLNQSGNATVSLVAGDVFGFRSLSDDNFGGGTSTTVTNFDPGFDGQFDPANWSVILDNSDGDAFFVEIPGGPLSFDACGIETLAVDVTEVSCADIGTPITVTVFASDASGNIASCQAVVTVVDALAPELTCPADQTVDPGSGNLFYEVPDYFATGEASALDNCTDPVTITTQDPAAGELIPDGTYTVTLTAEDEYGNVATCEFELTVESVLGTNSNELGSAIAMYPNPATNQVTLQNSSGIQLESAAIYDVSGKLVDQFDLRAMQGSQSIDISGLASGMYMVTITSEKASVVKRLVKE